MRAITLQFLWLHLGQRAGAKEQPVEKAGSSASWIPADTSAWPLGHTLCTCRERQTAGSQVPWDVLEQEACTCAMC